MRIYYNDTFLDINVDDNSFRYRALQVEHTLNLEFALDYEVDIPEGAWCEYQGVEYTLESLMDFQMHNTENYSYSLTLRGPDDPARLAKYRIRHPQDKKLKFSLTAQPKEHLQLIVDNLNMRSSGWSVGECIEGVEKVISYNFTNISEATTMVAEAFETEIEIVGYTINLRKIEYNKDNPLVVEYGYRKGMKPPIKRERLDESQAVEIMLAQGGSQNIDSSKYGSVELLLPKSQSIKFDGVLFEDEEGFDSSTARVYTADAEGFSIYRSDKELTTRYEDALDCSHIYPMRKGEVTAVEVVSVEDSFYNITDSTIPESLNYSLYRITDERMTIKFESGMLAGKEFDIHQSDDSLDGYNHATRTFEIVPQTIDGMVMPSGVYVPVVGDKYSVLHCALPDAYIADNATKSGASWDMMRACVKSLFDKETSKYSYSGEIDPMWSQSDWLNIGGRLVIGGYVRFIHSYYEPEGVLIRITGIKDYINKPYSPEIELSNSTVGGSVASLLDKVESNEVVMEDLHRESLRYSNRSWKAATETTRLLINAALEGFGSEINPIVVNTMQAIIGDTSLQFYFVDDRETPSVISHDAYFDTATGSFIADAGIVQHRTIGITAVAPSHSDDEYRYWSVPRFESPYLDAKDQAYYLYIKADKDSEDGEFKLSVKPISIEAEDGYYHLLVGILNSEMNGSRSWAPMYGFTAIEPGRMIVDQIQSSNFDIVKFEGMLIDLIEGRLIMGRDAEIIAQSLTIRPLDGEDIDAYGAITNAQTSADEANSKLEKVVPVTVYVDTNDGNLTINGIGEKILTATIFYGILDITATQEAWRFSWKRVSNDTVGDELWNAQHISVGRTISIDDSDVYRNAKFECYFDYEGIDFTKYLN